MIRLLANLPLDRFTLRTYILTSGDAHSFKRAIEFEQQQNHQRHVNASTCDCPSDSKRLDCAFITLPRARSVGQSYLSSIPTTLYSFLFSLDLIYTTAPNLLLMNGPGTCIPLCISVLILRVSSIVTLSSIITDLIDTQDKKYKDGVC